MVKQKSKSRVQGDPRRTKVINKRRSSRNAQLIFETVVSTQIGHYLQYHEMMSLYELRIRLKISSEKAENAMNRMQNLGMIRSGKINLHYWTKNFIAQICVLRPSENPGNVMTLQRGLNDILSEAEPSRKRGFKLLTAELTNKYGFEPVNRCITGLQIEGRKVVLAQLETMIKSSKNGEKTEEDDLGF